MEGTISKQRSSLIPQWGRKWKFHRSIFSRVMVRFIFMFHYTHAHACTHTRQPHIDGTVMTRTCLIRPGPWQGSRSDRDSSITWRVQEPPRLTHIKKKKGAHTHTHGGNSWSGWLLGHRCGDQGRKWELFPFFLFLLPLKRNSSPPPPQPPSTRLWKHPISIHISFTQFKTHTSFAPSASPPLSSSISYSQLGHASNLWRYLCWPFI